MGRNSGLLENVEREIGLREQLVPKVVRKEQVNN